MIINQFKGSAFARSLAYVIHKPGARFLGSNAFYDDVEAINSAMQTVAQRSARVQRPMMHFAISLAPGERLKDHQWRSLTRAYLQRLGYDNNQYVVVKHTDTPNHEHVHVVVNRVRWSGSVVRDSWSYYRSQTVARALEKEYGLMSVRMSWEPFEERSHQQEGAVNLPALPVVVQRRMDLQEQLRSWVNGALVTSQNLDEFIQQLEGQTVQVTLTHRQQKTVGIAFDFEGEHFTGRQLGKGYGLPGLLAALVKQNPVEPLQPEEAASESLPLELSYHHQLYLEMVDWVKEKTRSDLPRRQVDFQIAMLALRSSRPDAAKALVLSPDVQQLKREQGESAAMAYLRQLMEEAQERLRQLDLEKGAKKDQKER